MSVKRDHHYVPVFLSGRIHKGWKQRRFGKLIRKVWHLRVFSGVKVCLERVVPHLKRSLDPEPLTH